MPLPAPCPAAICALQNAAIIGLIFRLGTVARGTQLAVSAALAAAGWWLFAGGCPPAVLTALQTGSVALLALGGRLPQVGRGLRWWLGGRCKCAGRRCMGAPSCLSLSLQVCLHQCHVPACAVRHVPCCTAYPPLTPPPLPPQILLNLRRGNSGELSLGTCALSFVGNLARVFTTATLVKDPLILGSAAVQARLGGECL